MCCCAKARKDGDVTIEGPENRIRNINRILLEFVNEESKIGLREVPCIEMIEKVLLASNKGEVPKRDIIQIYKSTEQVNQNSIKNFMIQDFFFVDTSRQKYDFNKIVLFNLLYSGGKEIEKANFLFNVIENTSSSAVHNHSQKLLNTLENLTYISCIVVGEIINSVRRFQTDTEDSEFQELLSLYSTNANMLREFGNHIASIFLFPSSEDRQYLMRPDFIKKMEESAYLLIKPHEIRKKYTEYVWQNKARALLPSKLMRRTTHGIRENGEESKNPSEINDSIRQSARGTLRKQFSGQNQKQQYSRQISEAQLQNSANQQKQLRQDKMDKYLPLQSPYNYSNNDNLDKSSDISMAVYRYEDKSAQDSMSSPTNRQNKNKNNNAFQKQNYNQQYQQQQQQQLQKSQQNINKYFDQPALVQQNFSNQFTDKGHSPLLSPATAKLGSEVDIERDMKQRLKSLKLQGPSNRESSETQTSLLSTTNLRKYQNVQMYLKEMFGEQFVNMVAEMMEPFDAKKQSTLQMKLSDLRNSTKLEFPEYNAYPYHIREVFEYYNAILHKEDLLEFSKGKLFRDNIINVYLKILEKINLVRQSQYNYQRATTRNSVDIYSQNTSQTPQKILYFNTYFSRKLNNEAYVKDCLNMLQNFFKFDQVILPFFIDEEDDQRALIVSVKVANFQVDLYDRERDEDNHDISDTVLHLMDLSSRIQDVEFNEDQIDGGVEGVCVDREEDMLVAICYIAEQITFNKPVDLETFNVNLERQRILDVFLSLLQFK
ncbi:UNKNOWN [Stylonychia lemnae]|uniref:Uncharacterized protein n=1 Tax=Stylonychia lemnae TaxID=5949 RepID=A0A078B3W4_STYLE|nr:UNKNOWN [Stylonychia lemnae]|eukprot:CDW88208.1 UNKNOWN [Stylonychia lemnae]